MAAPASPAVPMRACPEQDGERRTITVQTSLFPAEVIQCAAHRFTGRFNVSMEAVGDGTVEVVLKARNNNPCEGIEDSFRNELLDEGLRAVVARESRLERDLILAHALSRHPVLHAEYESAAAFSDPQGLLTPDQK